MNTSLKLMLSINGEYMELDEAWALYEQLGEVLGVKEQIVNVEHIGGSVARLELPESQLPPGFLDAKVMDSGHTMRDVINIGEAAIKATEGAVNLDDQMLTNIVRNIGDLTQLIRGSDEKKSAYVARIVRIILTAVIAARTGIVLR